jgi:Xaa-Pro dipeptidase
MSLESNAATRSDAETYREVQFDPDEFDTRLSKVRLRMNEAGLAALLLTRPESIYYLSGLQSLGYWDPLCLIVPAMEPPIHVQFQFENYNVERQSRWSDYVGYGPDEVPMATVASTLRQVASDGELVGYEKKAWFTSEDDWEKLRANSAVRLVDASDMIKHVRMIKTEAELAYIRKAGRIVSRATVAGFAHGHEGVRECDVAAALYATAFAEGGHYPAIPLIIGAGVRSAMPHATWTERVLKDGDNLFIEAGSCVARYHAATMRNKIIGTPTAEQRSVTSVMVDALAAALAAIRPDATFHDVDAACRAVIRDAGLEEYWFTPTAYPIGIGFPPFWGETAQDPVALPGERAVLKSGMTLHVIPQVRVGGANIGVSETIVVREHGPELLTSVPRRLFSTLEDG